MFGNAIITGDAGKFGVTSRAYIRTIPINKTPNYGRDRW